MSLLQRAALAHTAKVVKTSNEKYCNNYSKLYNQLSCYVKSLNLIGKGELKLVTRVYDYKMCHESHFVTSRSTKGRKKLNEDFHRYNPLKIARYVKILFRGRLYIKDMGVFEFDKGKILPLELKISGIST